MGMTLKELLTKGEGTISAKAAKALAAQLSLIHILLELLAKRLDEAGVSHFTLQGSTPKPVSYTHLDVYKRQGP